MSDTSNILSSRITLKASIGSSGNQSSSSSIYRVRASKNASKSTESSALPTHPTDIMITEVISKNTFKCYSICSDYSQQILRVIASVQNFRSPFMF